MRKIVCATAQPLQRCVSVSFLAQSRKQGYVAYMPNSTTSATLSASAAAAESGIPKRTILYAIERKHLKAEKVPGVGYIIRRRDFTRWLERREAVSA